MEKLTSLVARTQAGDLDAYGEIVRRFQDMAYGYAYSILGDFHLAEDAAQEAFIEVYLCLGNLREPAAFPGWFRRIVFKQCDRMTRRKEIPAVPLEAAASTASPDRQPLQAAEDREMRDKVLAAIRSLPKQQREVTTLFYINGYSQSDIAEFLEVPMGTVKSRLAASRNRLKERVLNMASDEFKKHSLPESFTERVLTLGEIVNGPLGRHFEFQFANGVAVRTRIDKVIQDTRGVHLLLCGPTRVSCHNIPGSYPDCFDSFLLVPSSLVHVKSITESADTPPQSASPESSFELAGTEKPTQGHPGRFTPSPVATGLLDMAPEGFGYVRLGDKRESFEYRDRGGQKHTFPIAPDDIHVPEEMIRRHCLKQEDTVTCTWRRAVGNEHFPGVVEIRSINGVSVGKDRE